MAQFSNISKERLQTCHADLRVLFGHVIQGYDCTIVEGHRGKERQNRAFAEGKSKLKYPQSKHNKYPSLAVDAADMDSTYYKQIMVISVAAGHAVTGYGHRFWTFQNNDTIIFKQ
jgi:peptidoglycan LD-endopeptidase CwlK